LGIFLCLSSDFHSGFISVRPDFCGTHSSFPDARRASFGQAFFSLCLAVYLRK
jgi:hypothetical protein